MEKQGDKQREEGRSESSGGVKEGATEEKQMVAVLVVGKRGDRSGEGKGSVRTFITLIPIQHLSLNSDRDSPQSS